MTQANDAELLRISDDGDEAEWSRRSESTGPSGAMALAITKTVTTYPTSAGKYIACQTLKITGTETEGSAGVTANCGDTFYAWLPTGRTVPRTGTVVTCFWIAWRWVLDY